MQAKGFLASLFDYSFSFFVTSKIIKVLYVLTTIVVALWTILFIVLAFKASAAIGAVMLLIGGPIFFLISMIYARVVLEVLIIFFRISENVQAINDRGGASGARAVSQDAPPEPGTSPAAAPA